MHTLSNTGHCTVTGCICVWAGVTQRLVRAPGSSAVAHGSAPGHGAYPCFHAMPESQPVLPCLLRRLLQKGKADAATALAAHHSRWGFGPWHSSAAAGHLHWKPCTACSLRCPLLSSCTWLGGIYTLLCRSLAVHRTSAARWSGCCSQHWRQMPTGQPQLSSPSQPGTPAVLSRCGGPSTQARPADGEPCRTKPMLPCRQKSAGRRSNGAEWAALSAQPRTPSRSPGPQQLRSTPHSSAEKAAPRQPPLAGSLLVAAAQLIRNFSQAGPCPPAIVQTVLPSHLPHAVSCSLVCMTCFGRRCFAQRRP